MMTADGAKMRLEALCAASEQCTADLREKLRRWGVAADEAEAVIESLRSRRFVDDARFARAYVRDKYRFARWGRHKIVMGLRAKRISADDIDAALAEIDLDEYEELLTQLLRSKVRSGRLSREWPDRAKLLRFAASRGFESSLITRIVASGAPWQSASDDD